MKEHDRAAAAAMRIAVLMGGDTPEREVSLETGRAVADALAAAGHDVTARVIGAVAEVMGMDDLTGFDVVFPALHGGDGEDGHLQALLDLMGVTYALSGPRASAVAMDKSSTKRVLRGAGIPTPDWLLVSWEGSGSRPVSASGPGLADEGRLDLDRLCDRAAAELGFPLVLKPNADGSSVGVCIIEDPAGFDGAFAETTRHGSSVLLETYVPGRELTATILMGRRLPLVEIVPREGFYDYAHKYTTGASDYLCPAPVNSPLYEMISGDARRVFDLLGCRGVVRVDFRLDDTAYYCLEVNTVPGMTGNSLVPKAAAAVGIGFGDMLTDLCRDALRRARERDRRPAARSES
ncbi:D-alanine--D-alanine ligase [bacterium]|nr:D-alanine--D-alanine ligase [bacterium]